MACAFSPGPPRVGEPWWTGFTAIMVGSFMSSKEDAALSTSPVCRRRAHEEKEEDPEEDEEGDT